MMDTPSSSPSKSSKCQLANCNFILVFYMASFPHASQMFLVAMANLDPLSSTAKVFTSLYSIKIVIFLSAPLQYSPTLFKRD